MRTVAIIQARMGSTRLPGKALLPLAGVPAIRRVYDRARLIAGVDAVMVATTTSPQDDALAAYCDAHGIVVFRGSEADVLDRYVGAARSQQAGIVLRITGDCPLLDPVESAKVLALFRTTGGCDYACNCDPATLPDGLDTEVIGMAALARAAAMASDVPSREHVTLFIRRHPGVFRLAHCTHDPDLSAHRWTLDEPRDYAFLGRVADELAARNQFGHLEEVLVLLREKPELQQLNAGIARNEGLAKSLREEAARRGGGTTP